MAEKDTPRIGILGGGGILGAHAPWLKKYSDLAKVVALAEPRPDMVPRIRGFLGDEIRIYKDYAELLDHETLDAVDILLPHHLHMPAAVAAAQHGCHVLVEKAMARNIFECDRMIEVCEKSGVSLTVCHDRRYHGEWMALKTIVATGALGDVFYWKLDHNQYVFTAPGHWIRDANAIGGGAIMSCLTHQIDSLRHLGGEVESVACMTKILPDQMEGEALGIIAARMKSGALAQLSINWRTMSHAGANSLWYEMVHVCGTKGEAYFMHGRGTYVRIREGNIDAPGFEYDGERANNGFTKVKTGSWNGHEGCIREWIRSLRGETADIVTSGRAVRGTVEVAEAAYLAEREARTVILPIQPVPWRDAHAG